MNSSASRWRLKKAATWWLRRSMPSFSCFASSCFSLSSSRFWMRVPCWRKQKDKRTSQTQRGYSVCDTSRSDTLYTSSNTLSTSSNTVPGLAHLVPVKHIQYKFLHIPYIIIQDIQYQILHIYYNRNTLTNSSEKPLICSISTLTRSECFIVFGTCYVDILNNKPLNTSSKSNSNTGCLNTIYFIIFTKMYFSLKCRCIGCSYFMFAAPLCKCTDCTANGSYFLFTVPLCKCTDSIANGLTFCSLSPSVSALIVLLMALTFCSLPPSVSAVIVLLMTLTFCSLSPSVSALIVLLMALTFCSLSPSVSALIVLLMVLLSVHCPLP